MKIEFTSPSSPFPRFIKHSCCRSSPQFECQIIYSFWCTMSPWFVLFLFTTVTSFIPKKQFKCKENCNGNLPSNAFSHIHIFKKSAQHRNPQNSPPVFFIVRLLYSHYADFLSTFKELFAYKEGFFALPNFLRKAFSHPCKQMCDGKKAKDVVRKAF